MNAVARLLGGLALKPRGRGATEAALLEAQVEEWVEWEEKTLRPAAVNPKPAPLQGAVTKLGKHLKARAHLVGDAVSLADIAVFCTLLPVCEAGQLPAAKGGEDRVVAEWMRAQEEHPAFQQGVAAVAGGQGRAAFAAYLERAKAAGRQPKPSASGKAPPPASSAAAASPAGGEGPYVPPAALFRGSGPRLPVDGARNVLVSARSSVAWSRGRAEGLNRRGPGLTDDRTGPNQVTSALPYVNNVPHLGNIIGCVLSADCYARFARARGHNTVFICGTDEYGTATETKALEEGLTCQQICDKYHAIHKDVYEWFGCQFENFGRTTTPAQTEIAQGIFTDLLEQGLLEEKTTEQLYSVKAGKFLADRLVEGTCPHCGYADARGDQCDSCGKLLNPTELKDPRCKLTGTTPEVRETTHMYIDLPKLAEKHAAYVQTMSEKGGWSSNCIKVTESWVRDGLQPRCITRDLKWGTPVPMEKFKEKVFYVWFDAPIGYISMTATYTPEWRQWWHNPDKVDLIQFMGKDNIPFHTIIFPCSLIGTGQPWTMMKSISVTEYLNYEGDKFSKSRGKGVFGNNVQETGIPPEIWRYYLLAVRPEQADTDFKWSDLAAKANGELLKNLGNYINRSVSFLNSRFDSAVPEPSPEGEADALALGGEVRALVEQYVEAMENQKLKLGVQTILQISSLGNLYLQTQQPWVLLKAEPEKCRTVVAACVGLVKVLAALIQPFMPTITDKILQQLNLGLEESVMLTDAMVAACAAPHRLLPAGHRINKGFPLFAEIKDETVAALRAKYSGEQVAESGAPAAAPAAKPAAKLGKDGKPVKPVKKGKDAPKPVDVTRLSLRVGVITKVWRHPDADTLYCEEIDLGEEGGPRTVVSGLVKFIPEEEMLGKRVVCVTNMKPSKMRGVTSQAMVLAASNADGTKVELVTPPEGAGVGDPVSFEGYASDVADERLNPKHKVFEKVAKDFKTGDDCVAKYKGIPFTTPAGPCKVDTIAGGGIK